MAGMTQLEQNTNPTNPPSSGSGSGNTDPNAKKCVTEEELGKMTMWIWGAR